ncbi:MAG: C1q-like domain-containing protein [Bacteroidia bacterium]
MKKILLFLLSIHLLVNAFSQNVGINTNTPAASAALDVVSTTQGVLVPRMTAAQRGIIASPATGLLVYQTDAPAGFYFYNGTAWTSLNGGSALPSQSGNSGKYLTTDGTSASWATVSGGGGGGASLQLMVNATDAVNYPGAAITLVDYGTPVTNVASQFNASNETFTVATTGLYHISACLTWNTTSGGFVGIYVNNTLKLMEAQTSSTQIAPFNRASATAAGVLSLTAGDAVKIQFGANVNATTSIANLSQYTIVKLN